MSTSSSSSSSSSSSATFSPSSCPSASPSPSLSFSSSSSPSTTPSSSSSSSSSASGPSPSSSPSSPSSSSSISPSASPPPDVPDPDIYFEPDGPQGTGLLSTFSKFKDITFNLSIKDAYGNIIDDDVQLAQNFSDSFYYNASLYTTGATTGNMSPYLVAENFISDKYSLNVSFTQDQNASYFGSSGAQRYYKLLLDLYNRGLKSSALLSVFHYPAIITGIVVNDFYTPVVIGTGENETGNLSGQVNFDITFTGGIGTNYIVKSLDIYTGASSGTPSSLNGFSLLKNVSVFDDSQTQNFIILNTEVPNNTGLFYKFRAYDDFGAGITFANSVSGYLGYVEPPLFFGVAIPPALNEYQRITGYFTGLDSPVRTTGRDGAIVFQDDENLDQDFYVLKSGQWKTLAIYEEITGKFARFVQAPAVSTGLGQLGDFAVSGQYLYTATGANKWGRTLLSDWYGPIGSFSWSGSGNNGIAYISWTSADQATGYIVYRAETALTGTYQQIFSGTGNSYNDAVPAPDNVWFYNVAAFNDSYISSGTAAAINVPP